MLMARIGEMGGKGREGEGREERGERRRGAYLWNGLSLLSLTSFVICLLLCVRFTWNSSSSYINMSGRKKGEKEGEGSRGEDSEQ